MATGKCFFFKGDKYVRFDVATNKIDPGYPRLIADDWLGMKEAGFDRDLSGAVYWGDWRLYFFKGEQFVLFDLRANKVVEGAPWPIVSPGNWQGVQNAGFGANIDAAVNWGSNGKLYFFKGDQFIRFDMPTNHMDGNSSAPIYSPSYPNNWPGLNQDGFDSSLDAALNWGDGKLYFFKGDKFIRFDATTNRAEGVPTLIDSPNNWNGLAAADFASDIDAATRLGGDRPYQGPEPSTAPSPPLPSPALQTGRQCCFDLPPNTTFYVAAMNTEQWVRTVLVIIDGKEAQPVNLPANDNGLVQVYKSGAGSPPSGKSRVCIGIDDSKSGHMQLGWYPPVVVADGEFVNIGAEKDYQKEAGFNDAAVCVYWRNS